MRASNFASSVAWRMRWCRPWLIATSVGLAMGWSLLRIGAEDSDEMLTLPSSYPEFAPRAAVQDFSLSGESASGLREANFALPPSVSATASTAASAFAPAAPISAEAVPSDALLYSAE